MSNLSLRQFLEQWETAHPDDVVHLPDGTSVDYVPTALALELERRGQTPIIQIDRPTGFDVPFVAVVADDAVWAQIKHELDVVYGPGRDAPVRMEQRRWDQVVAALGGHGEHVTRPEELGPALDRALASGKPSCVHVVTQSVVSPETLWAFSPEERSRRLAEA